ncbi:hypothetical protein HHI36_012703 [Cryptolaemus montrouzieri]|uniref:DUF4817 domain-containing protein n=1 Tax=Cryptolaemus montrouzieri TaxID=559131 RepID=A0ABD2NF07_9CUCU
MYTIDEKVDMLLIYGECKNSRRAAELYAECFPNRDEVPNNYFFRLERQFRGLPVQPDVQFIIDEATEIKVLAMVEIDSTISLRQIENETGIPRETARRILKKIEFKSFKYQIHQHLYPYDSFTVIEHTALGLSFFSGSHEL